MVIEKNVRYLNDRVKMTGFGEIYEAEIRENIGKGLDSFTINVKREFGDQDTRDTTESILYFNKGKEDYYHFNKYDMRITTRPDDVAASTWESVHVDHKFKQNTYTLKEMYNLKLGGSVEKEVKYLKKNPETDQDEEKSFIGFKKADHRELNKYNSYPKTNIPWPLMEKQLRDSLAIKSLADPKLADGLVKSMKKGNVQRVTLKHGETEIVRWIAIDAEFKKIGIYETNPRIYVSNAEALARKQAAAERYAATGKAESPFDGPERPAAVLDAQGNPTGKVVPLYPEKAPAKAETPEPGELKPDPGSKVVGGEAKENIFTRKLEENQTKVHGENTALSPSGKEAGLAAGEGGSGKGTAVKAVDPGVKPPKNGVKKTPPIKTTKVTKAKGRKAAHKV